MTKSLTEQYMEGIIKEGDFWAVKKGCEPSIIYLFDSPTARRGIKAKRLKLLAPVPSYDEYKELVSKTEQLEQQLAEANRVITSYIRNFPLEKYSPAEAYVERWGVK